MSALSEKDPNAQISPSKSQSSNSQAGVMEQKDMEKSVLSKKINGTTGTYVSPSDAIMSPASKKLANFKQKQIDRKHDGAKRSLFSRTLSTNSDQTSSTLDDWK